jgi:selenocysteine-specific elongation factor
MKAKDDVSAEVAQLKGWKMEIARLSKAVNDAERGRDVLLDGINAALANIDLDDGRMNSTPVVGVHSIEKNDDDKDNDATTMGVGTDGSNNGVGVDRDRKGTRKTLSISAAVFSPKTCTAKSTSGITNPGPTSTTAAAPAGALPLLLPEEIKSIPPERILNINVGVLGHVDTGKTSLVKTLSSVLSTAALDKSKQSRARGITLDLGFSAFLLPLPEHLREGSDADDGGIFGRGGDGSSSGGVGSGSGRNASENDDAEVGVRGSDLHGKYDLLQVTLVDCPGHASLIRTIIGGAQIIDMILLVVDATKGMQTQTAECLVIAEMTTRNLIVVLNKIDMFPEHEREERLRVAERKMRAGLRGTKFEHARMVGISACVGGEKVAAVGADAEHFGSSSTKVAGTHNIHGLLDLLQSQIRAPNRDARPSPDQFHFAVDHCFPIKGQGTVLTGTCLAGSARPNDIVEFPTLATQKKIKGLQMFRRKASVIQQGDRAGICVSNFDAKLMERGIIASPGTVKLIRGAIAVVRKVRFFKGGLNSGAKFHISVGHTTVMATVTFWGAREIAKQVQCDEEKSKDASTRAFGKSSLGGSADLAGLPRLKFDWDQDFLHQDNYLDALPTSDDNSEWNDSTPEQGKRNDATLPPLHWARLEFHTPVYCPMDSLVIGSRLDSEVNANACRLAFSGRLVLRYDAKSVSDSLAKVICIVPSLNCLIYISSLILLKDHGRLRTYTKKEKMGTVCRLGDPYRRTDDSKLVRYEIFGEGLFKKETNMTQFVGLLVETNNGDIGSIQSSFGTSGKFRVNFPAGTDIREGDPLYLRFKRYANDPKKAIHQDGILPPARTGTIVDPPPKKKKKNGKSQRGSQQAATTPKDIAKQSDSFGDILNLKGEVLENGRHTIAIVSGLFSMEDDIRQHKGRSVLSVSTKEEGIVDGSFGKMGKCKVFFKEGISADIGSKVKILGK